MGEMAGFASHELMIPHVDNDGNDLSYLMPAVKSHLAQNGINGFTVHPAVGTYTNQSGEHYPDEDMHHLTADVPDTPEHDQLFSDLAQAIAHEGRQQAIYHRKTPVSVELAEPFQHPHIDLSQQGAPAGIGQEWADNPDFASAIFQ